MTRILIAAAIVGAVVGLAIGFAVYTLANGRMSYGIVIWITREDIGAGPVGALFWTLGGAIVGAGIVYIMRSWRND
jgi:hypothetical protein